MKTIILALLSSTLFFVSVNAQTEKQILNQKLIDAKHSLATVQSTAAKTPISFQKITLFKRPILISNKDYEAHAFKIPRLIPDKYYDAFVFKSTKGGYLYWSFQMDSTYLGSWYMLKYATNSSRSSPTDSITKKNINYFSDFSYDAKTSTSRFNLSSSTAS